MFSLLLMDKSVEALSSTAHAESLPTSNRINITCSFKSIQSRYHQQQGTNAINCKFKQDIWRELKGFHDLI